MKRIVMGILAHVDSGKTTLSESMLYISGELKKIGRVDHGDSFLDSNELERNRGVTIFSKQAVMHMSDTVVTILDTPGHVDFSAEMERTLQVLDYAILVISGSDGVQSHTETLWRLLTKHGIPVFVFVNKMDLVWKKRDQLLAELRAHLSDNLIDFSNADTVSRDEDIATCDERLTDSFIQNGCLEDTDIADAIASRKIFPCFFGVALKNEGVDVFLQNLEKYTKASEERKNFAAKVFKIARDNQGNRLTYMKITGGTLCVRDTLTGTDKSNEPWEEKVNQIRVYSGAGFEAVKDAQCGTVCAVTGLSGTFPGQGLGEERQSVPEMLEPVMTYKVNIQDDTDVHTALANLRILEEEEPKLYVVWNERLQEIHVQVMGEMQLEILESIALTRFGMNISFDQGNIVYKETIADTVEGVGHFEPLRHYAEVHLIMEPGERGSGLCFDVDCSEDRLDRNWQRLILSHLEEKVHIGVLTGSPITDMKIILSDGKAHKKHTEGGDFRQATYRAVRQGLMSARSILLEPWFDFTMIVPSDCVGRAMSDIQRMSGSFDPPEMNETDAVIHGRAPVSTMSGYQRELAGYSGGRGSIACIMSGYEECHNPEEVMEQIGYDCEGDTENSADSVFCDNGGSNIIKWNMVPERMHLESSLKKDRQELKEDYAARAAAFTASIADDKELMRIFERTYGPIKNTHRIDQRIVKPKPQEQYISRAGKHQKETGPEYLLIDGYNLIHADEEMKELAAADFGAARDKLIDIMCNYQGFQNCNLILVFDAYKVKNNAGSVEKINNINVVYTKEAETADMYIEKVTHRIGQKHRVRVVTSDGLEQLIIMGHGALRTPSRLFWQEVREVEEAIRTYLEL